ncbi:LysR family transcriptional regulator [Streptomyces sp. NRRL F-5135]|uniref:LysR family transcriptional regulator n=1 Tax=Streptomyces sp. NRRL F-5135 TaxID=1463858 RepID=UPI0004C4B2C2|nr:LysR family transcriptional regulator [Streptomyces sp. NRRL F-5135]
MLLRQLEYLVALASERHFGRAADACFVSQPSLSAGIRKLERELDVTIVRRGRRFEGLTPEGERVLVWAHRMLAERDALRQELSALRGGLSGTLRLGVVPTALTAISLVTTPFCAEHPLVRICLESLPAHEIGRRLAAFELDAAVTYLDDTAPRRTRRLPLYEERYLLLTPDDETFTGARTVSWARAAELPLCLLAPSMRNRRVMDECFAADGVEAKPVLESDTVAGLYAHLGGGWSGVIAQAWLHTFGVPAGMRVLPLEGPVRGPRVGLAVAAHDPAPALVRALWDIARRTRLRDVLDDLLESHLVPYRRTGRPGP